MRRQASAEDPARLAPASALWSLGIKSARGLGLLSARELRVLSAWKLRFLSARELGVLAAGELHLLPTRGLRLLSTCRLGDVARWHRRIGGGGHQHGAQSECECVCPLHVVFSFLVLLLSGPRRPSWSRWRAPDMP